MHPVLSFALLLLAAASSLAQQVGPSGSAIHSPGQGQIVGQVLDPVGDPVPDAAVQLFPPQRTSVADAGGHFLLSAIPDGRYTLKLSAPGFQPSETPVEVQGGDALRLAPIKLTLAAAGDSIDVTATRREVAEAQLKQEEQQRFLGILPNFYIVYDPTAPALTAPQKYRLATRTLIDPSTFIVEAIVAGAEQAADVFPGYRQGALGYTKRYFAGLADATSGIFFSGAIFPALFHQDPRYFVKGTGSVGSRVRYAIDSAVLCRGDNGHREVNFAGIVGGLAASGLSNAYYPASDRQGATLTFENLGIGLASDAIGSLVQEFLLPHLTTHKPTRPAKSTTAPAQP